jgi:hypothetical protein
MTRTTPLQNVFSAGELSPRLHMRTDFERHQTGLRRANGFIPLRQGGITRAPGTIYWDRTRSDAVCRLLPFEFNREDAVLLEFYPGVMRVRRYGQLVMSGSSPYELAHPYDAAAIARLSWVQSADVIYLADGARPIHRLSRFALDNWTITPQQIDTGPFKLRNVDEAKTVLASAETGTITLTANFALFTAAHVGSLMVLEPTDWPDVGLWTQDTPATAGVTRMRYDGRVYLLTAGTNTGAVPPQHVSGTQKTDHNTNATWQFLSDGEGIVRITAVAGSTSATATVIKRIPAPVLDAGTYKPIATYRWAESAWSNVYGYPRYLELYDQRFVAAATDSEPRTLWLSAAGGGYADFAQGERPDDAFAAIIEGDGSLNPIQWLRRGDRALHIGALNEEYSLRSDSRNTALAATNARIGMDSKIGSHTAPPVAPEGSPIFISRDRRRVFELRYVIEYDANVMRELSLPSDHLGEAGPFEQIVWQSSPWRMAWLRQQTGNLVCMIYDRDEQVLGWTPLSLAGGIVEDMAVTPTDCDGSDMLVLIVRRVIDGQTRRHIEVMAAPAIAPSCGVEVTHFFAASVFEAEPAQTEFSVPHLANEQVMVWTEQGGFGPLTVSASGGVILDVPVARAEVGLFDETHFMETLALQAATPNGSPFGRNLRAEAISGIGVYKTEQGFVQFVTYEAGQQPRAGSPIPLIKLPVGVDRTAAVTGIVSPNVQAGVGREVSLRINPHAGAAMTITAICARMIEMGT